MSIADPVFSKTADTSDLCNMFGAFCTHIFEQRDIIMENFHNIFSENQEATEKKNDTHLDVLDTISTLDKTKDDLPHDFRLMHKNICMYIKSALDSEKISSFHKNTREAIYAMVAIADEIFLNMEWAGKGFWQVNMLELKFFGTQIAGEEIYRKINSLLEEDNLLSLEKAEIYIKMLSIGFMGKFRGQHESERNINMYRSKLFAFIFKKDTTIGETIEYRIFQKEYSYTMPTVNRKLLADPSIITYFSFFFIFMFLVITTCVWIIKTKDIERLLLDISYAILRE